MAAALCLGLLPAPPAFAEDKVTITIENGVPEGNGVTWDYDSTNNTLTLKSGGTRYEINGAFSGTVFNYGNITDGTFSGTVDNYGAGTINDGAFSGTVNNYATINGGTFSGTVNNRLTISGGEFSGTVTNDGTISGGEFSGTVNNYATIESGVFYDGVNNNSNGNISNGTFHGTVNNNSNGNISNGTFSGTVNNRGTINGGRFSGEIYNHGTLESGANIAAATVYGHFHNEFQTNQVAFTALKSTDTNLSAGSYYLPDQGLNLSSTLTVNVGEGNKVDLCLHGETLTAPGSNAAIKVNSGTLNIHDCNGDGKITAGNTGIWVGGGALHLYGGTVSGIYDGVDVYGGTFTLHGGAVSEVRLYGRAFFLNGGRIDKCVFANSGSWSEPITVGENFRSEGEPISVAFPTNAPNSVPQAITGANKENISEWFRVAEDQNWYCIQDGPNHEVQLDAPLKVDPLTFEGEPPASPTAAPPEAQPITITNRGGQTVRFDSVTLTGEDSEKFTVIDSENQTVTPGQPNKTWQLQPNAGLSAGTYEATIAVKYTQGITTFTAKAPVTYTVTAPSATTPLPSAADDDDDDDYKTPAQQAADKIESAQPGDKVELKLPSSGKVDKEVFESLAGNDVTLEITLPGGLTWTVNGQDIPKGTNFSDLNLGVSLGTNGISAEVINKVTGEKTSIQLTLSHNGPFGFALTLTAPLGKENAGFWANLYHFNEKTGVLDYESSTIIGTDGAAALKLTHASQYAIVIDDKSHAPQTPWKNPFTDVSENDWFYENVRYSCENGLITGTSATTFAPTLPTTRAMLMTILARLDGVDTAPSGEVWYEKGMAWAVQNKISDGTNPEASITREQLAVMLYRYAQKQGEETDETVGLSGFADAEQVSDWAQDALRWAVSEGIISGTSATTLTPQGNATRAEAAAMLQRYLEK